MTHLNSIRFHDYERFPTALHTFHWSKQPSSSDYSNTNITFRWFRVQFVQAIHDVLGRETIGLDPFIIFLFSSTFRYMIFSNNNWSSFSFARLKKITRFEKILQLLHFCNYSKQTNVFFTVKITFCVYNVVF